MGGIHLYAILANSPINYYDIRGMWSTEVNSFLEMLLAAILQAAQLSIEGQSTMVWYSQRIL